MNSVGHFAYSSIPEISLGLELLLFWISLRITKELQWNLMTSKLMDVYKDLYIIQILDVKLETIEPLSQYKTIQYTQKL